MLAARGQEVRGQEVRAGPDQALDDARAVRGRLRRQRAAEDVAVRALLRARAAVEDAAVSRQRAVALRVRRVQQAMAPLSSARYRQIAAALQRGEAVAVARFDAGSVRHVVVSGARVRELQAAAVAVRERHDAAVADAVAACGRAAQAVLRLCPRGVPGLSAAELHAMVAARGVSVGSEA